MKKSKPTRQPLPVAKTMPSQIDELIAFLKENRNAIEIIECSVVYKGKMGKDSKEKELLAHVHGGDKLKIMGLTCASILRLYSQATATE